MLTTHPRDAGCLTSLWLPTQLNTQYRKQRRITAPFTLSVIVRGLDRPPTEMSYTRPLMPHQLETNALRLRDLEYDEVELDWGGCGSLMGPPELNCHHTITSSQAGWRIRVLGSHWCHFRSRLEQVITIACTRHSVGAYAEERQVQESTKAHRSGRRWCVMPVCGPAAPRLQTE